MTKKDKKHAEGYLKGNQRKVFLITNWITNVVNDNQWGLDNYREDIVQDVRMKLFINLKENRFNYNSSLKTYVYRIAKYTCIDYLRKKRHTTEVVLDFTESRDEECMFTALLQKEQEKIFEKIYRQLTKECQKILRMVFMEKLSYKSIAPRLGIAEGTVKSRVFRCKENAIQLRKEITE